MQYLERRYMAVASEADHIMKAHGDQLKRAKRAKKEAKNNARKRAAQATEDKKEAEENLKRIKDAKRPIRPSANWPIPYKSRARR